MLAVNTRYHARVTQRAAVYCRISEDPRATELGVARQRKDCEALVTARGWTLVGVFVDNDVAVLTATAPRPRYAAMMAAVERGELDRIVAYGLSRLWRNRRERADAIELLKRRQVSVTLVRGSDLDMTSAMGRMVAGMIGEADTAESELKSERVAAAALQRAERGKANGHVAYGWRRERTRNADGDVIDWHDEIDRAQANIVHEIVERLLAAEPIRAIVADLNRRGVVPPRAALRAATGKPGGTTAHVPARWLPSTVRKIALRPANAGRMVRGRVEFGDAAAPRIIEPEQHDRVVALLNDPARLRRPVRADPELTGRTIRPGARKHLLTFGIGECGVCGAHLKVATRYRGRNKTHPYPTYQCDGPRSCVTRAQAPVDDLVERVVVRRLQEPDARALLTRNDTEARAARQRVAALDAKVDRLQDDYDADLIDRRRYERSMARFRAELAAAQREATRRVRGVAPELVAQLAGPHAQARWAALREPTQRRALLEAMGVVVTILPARGGAGFKPESVRVEFMQAEAPGPAQTVEEPA